MVSVSKLCCPVCWELFKALKLGTHIRGCHPTVTPLALPETLSPEISREMVARCQALLASQLKPLLSTEQAHTKQHYRNDSETGYSAASSNMIEGASECSPSYNSWRENLTRKKDAAAQAKP
jgi:hypothetical protein